MFVVEHAPLVFWAICVATLGLGLIELILAWRLTGWVFSIGPRVYSERVRHGVLNQRNQQGTKSAFVPGGRYRFANENVVVFLRDTLVVPSTPFPIKGSLVLDRDSGLARVCGRLPLGSTSFIVIWLALWTIGGLVVASRQDSLMRSAVVLGGTLVGSLLAGWIMQRAVKLEKRRVEELAKRVLAQLSAASQPSGHGRGPDGLR